MGVSMAWHCRQCRIAARVGCLRPICSPPTPRALVAFGRFALRAGAEAGKAAAARPTGAEEGRCSSNTDQTRQQDAKQADLDEGLDLVQDHGLQWIRQLQRVS